MGWYRQVLSDREEWRSSLKQGKLTVINTLFKLFYSLGNIRRCADLIRDAEKQPIDLSLFPQAQAVTYQYYLGRTYLFDDRYPEAEACLTYALEHCHRAAAGNVARVLTVLVPLRLQLNRPVNGRALRARGMGQLADLAEAVAEGHVAKYHAWFVYHRFFFFLALFFFLYSRSNHHTLLPECLLYSAEEHMMYFIETGVYLLVERLLMNVYRNLFRRVYVVLQPPYIPPYMPPCTAFPLHRSHTLSHPVSPPDLSIAQAPQLHPGDGGPRACARAAP